MKVTVVVPVFNERETLEPLAEGILAHCTSHDCRILFIDDGSTDGSDAALRGLHERHARIDVLRFRRNFGKAAALAAGFAEARGDVILTMDADLQDDPKEIPGFLSKIEEGYDVVCGWKKVRHDPWHKTFPSRIYNKAVAGLFRVGLHDVNCGFKALRAEVARAIPMYGDLHRLIPVLAANLGYRVTEIPVEHQPRRYGVSKYGIERFARGAADVLSVWFLNRYAQSPGHGFGAAGMVSFLLTLLATLAACVAWLAVRSGMAALLLAVIGVGFFLAGVVSVGLGLIAEMLVRRHAGTGPRPFIAEALIHHADD